MINNLIKRFEFAPALAFARKRGGSALIMTIVLTVMLAVIAVMFVAVARMDSAATSNIADNKMLESAAKSIVELINRQLVLDTPGIATPSQEYYDYPDACDTWLASLEPYKSGTDYYWRQISDVTGFLQSHSYPTTDVNTDPPGNRKVIQEYSDITLDISLNLQNNLADADGDGIADSKWIELPDIRTSKGKKIYAAVRIIDNSGMINVNTAYRFDANSSDANEIDGTSQMQINLNGLLKAGDNISDLHNARCNSISKSRDDYENRSIWRYYGVPDGNYTPFDISNELELRYRYCIDGRIKARIEEPTLPNTIRGKGNDDVGNLYDGSTDWGLHDWQVRITDPNFPNDTEADRRHLLTALNLDRIITPDGEKMVNINDANVDDLDKIFLKMGFSDEVSAQIAVNTIDYRDNDSNVTTLDACGVTYYGLERPCVYISELAYRGGVDGNSYAVELYKPYTVDDNPDPNWQLVIQNPIQNPDMTIPITGWSVNSQFYVIVWKDPCCPLDACGIGIGQEIDNSSHSKIFDGSSTILLTRRVNDVNIVVDSIPLVPSGWMTPDSNEHSLQRDITQAYCIRRQWDQSPTGSGAPMLGSGNTYYDTGDMNTIQAHPANSNFTNIGEMGKILCKGAYYERGDSATGIIGYYNTNNTESEVRLNLADSAFQWIFNYLTVWPPSYANQNETRVKGRININTAPASVLAQLPWVSLRNNPAGYNDANLAKAIVAYRDKQNLTASGGPDYSSRPDPCGFGTIGQLTKVTDPALRDYSIDYYIRDDMAGDQTGFPDIDPAVDDAEDDFEERDLIFARISDLVTVRSDVFTAYILVRVCTNVNSSNEVEGPQKRYMVIFDRSNVVNNSNKAVIRAFQTVPEAR